MKTHFEAMENRQRSRIDRVEYGFGDTPYGTCFVGLIDGAVCALSFPDAEDAVAALRECWPQADCIENSEAAAGVIALIFNPKTEDGEPLRVLLCGTPFQVAVWQALAAVPAGEVLTYSELAQRAGCDRAVRAVGSAMARNPVAVLVPCHRVIRRDGHLGGYRWGTARKERLLAAEAR